MNNATAFAPQQGLESLIPAHLVRQADDFKTRYLFLPVWAYSSSHQLAQNGEIAPGVIHKLMPPTRTYRPDELENAGIKRDQVQEVIKVGQFGERELWRYAEPIRPVLNIILGATQEQGGVEIAALAGLDLDAGLLGRINAWLFSAGSDTAANLKKSLERAGEKEFFEQQGFPADARQIFADVLAQCRQGYDRALAGVRREYDQYVRDYEASRIPNSGVEFHDSKRYRQVLAWLGEIPVTEYAQRQANAGLSSVLNEVQQLKQEQVQTTNALAGALTTLGEGQKALAEAVTALKPEEKPQEPAKNNNARK